MECPPTCVRLLREESPDRRRDLISQIGASALDLEWMLNESRSVASDDALRAQLCAECATQVASHIGDVRGACAAHRLIGQALRVQSRHQDAISHFDAAAALAASCSDDLVSAQCRLGVVDSLARLERYDEAVALGEQLEARFTLLGSSVDAAKAAVNIGNIHHRRDQYSLARACYERALEPLRGTGDLDAVARVEGNLANILTHFNRIDDAMALYDSVRTAFGGLGADLLAAKVDGNVGFLRYISGQYSASLAALTRARRAFEQRGLRLEVAQCDQMMGDVYSRLNLWREALECLDRAAAALKSTQTAYELARVEIGRAAALWALDRMDECLAAFGRADRVFRSQGNELYRAHLRLRRSHALRSAGQPERARRDARASARVFTASQQTGWAAEARYVIADLDYADGKDATRAMMSVARDAKSAARGVLESQAEYAIGRHFNSLGHSDKALKHLRSSVGALEQARTLVTIEDLHIALLRDNLGAYDDLVRMLLERWLRTGRERDISDALSWVERSKSRLLLERVQSAQDIRHDRTGGSPELAERVASLRAELCRNYHGVHAFDGAEQQRKIGIEYGGSDALLAVEDAYKDALREFDLTQAVDDDPVRSLAQVVPARRLQMALQDDETLVEYCSLFGQICAFVITNQRIVARLNIASTDLVSHAARRLRYHLQRVEVLDSYVQRHSEQLHSSIRDVLTQLYGLVLQPLSELLETDKLIVVPHGELHGLPFHAMHDGTGYALDRWEVSYAPGAAVWYAGAQKKKARSVDVSTELMSAPALLMAVPGPGIERVSEEVAQVAKMLPNSVVFEGDQATIGAFHAHASESRVLHLATHALFRADNPLFSGLRLADGWLLARDLYDIALDCELATLSACRTGAAKVGPGDELFGLVRGFLAAGARSLAVSLWPADDAATTWLMTRFYAHLANGMRRAAALRRAQQETRDVYTHPYHWAAFALVGET